MATRPLRQYYDGVAIVVDDDLPLIDPWLRHRERLLATLGALSDDQWKSTTRCTAWDARGVVSHLVTVDAFWMGSMQGAKTRGAPTTFIRGFDPSSGTDVFVDPMLELPTDVIFRRFADGTAAFVEIVEGFEPDDWDAPGEAPFGHVPARMLMAHAHWDSWLHERDILEPLGLDLPDESDELLVALWYTLVVGALQGGLLDDDAPMGPGPDAPIDVTLCFDELPGDALRVQIDTGVRITRAAPAHAVPAGSAVELVETVTGRRNSTALDALPDDLRAQLARAAQIL